MTLRRDSEALTSTGLERTARLRWIISSLDRTTMLCQRQYCLLPVFTFAEAGGRTACGYVYSRASPSVWCDSVLATCT